MNQSTFALRTIALAIFLSCTLAAAETSTVVEVKSPERILLNYHGLPIYVALAHCEFGESADIDAKAVQSLQQSLKGKSVSIIHKESFGHQDGIPLVYLKVGAAIINVKMISQGFAAFPDSGKKGNSYARYMEKGQEKAQQAKLGLWSGGQTTPPKMVAKNESGQFAAELDTPYYYPRGDKALANNINPSKLIWYANEAAAERAGKKPAPRNTVSVAADDGTLGTADAAFEKGKALYVKAMNMGVSRDRDDTYHAAFKALTIAVRRYSAIAEKNPDDQALEKKLRQAAQMRYGAMKYRRT